MTQTIQPISLTLTQEEDINVSFSCYRAVKDAKMTARENLSLLTSIYDNMNSLCTALERLDYVMEKIIFNKEKEKGK